MFREYIVWISGDCDHPVCQHPVIAKKLLGRLTYRSEPFSIGLQHPSSGIIPVHRCERDSRISDIRSEVPLGREDSSLHERVRCARYVGLMTMLLNAL